MRSKERSAIRTDGYSKSQRKAYVRHRKTISLKLVYYFAFKHNEFFFKKYILSLWYYLVNICGVSTINPNKIAIGEVSQTFKVEKI